MIAALYVETNGRYFNLDGVEPWDQERDARKYDGPWPVVAHPPCQSCGGEPARRSFQPRPSPSMGWRSASAWVNWRSRGGREGQRAPDRNPARVSANSDRHGKKRSCRAFSPFRYGNHVLKGVMNKGETGMNFASYKTLPPATAAIMQAAYDRRAAAGLIGKHGACHGNAKTKALHDAGVSQFSREYFEAICDGPDA